MEQAVSITAFYPELILAIAGCAALLLGPAQRATVRNAIPGVALAGVIAAVALVFFRYQEADHTGAGFVFGGVAYYVRISGLVLGVLLVLSAWGQARDGEQGEFVSMMVFSLLGLLLVAPADNLILLFLALEIVSIPTYILVTISRFNVRALEAGTKYFYLGALSAAIMAYGFTFLYGATGSITLSGAVYEMQNALSGARGPLAQNLGYIGLFLTMAGLFFKIAAVPLHFYIADVYQGSANAVAGLLGFVPKLAGFVAIFKILSLTTVWQGGSVPIYAILWVGAALSMTIGNVLALRQSNIKRMLAYSGIAHSGYMLVAVIAGPLSGTSGTMSSGMGAVLYYAVVYGIANLAAFLILGILRNRGRVCESVRDVAGLIRKEPVYALLLALAFLTLMGLPPTPGFWGKLSLFGSALSAAQASEGLSGWTYALVIIAVLNTAIGAAYYLRVVAAVLLYDEDEPAEADATAEWPSMGAYMCGVLLLIFSFYPNALLMSGLAATRSAIQSETMQVSVLDERGSDETVVAGEVEEINAAAADAAQFNMPTQSGD
ncbi:MAG: NADH-quinone oxidoreductase subunit N [Phycisphaerae bacterium]